MADIIGMFDLVSTEGLDNYLKTVGKPKYPIVTVAGCMAFKITTSHAGIFYVSGVNFLLRKLAGSVTNAQMEITKAGNEYIIKNINKIKSSEVKFRLGEEVKETTMDGREVIVSIGI